MTLYYQVNYTLTDVPEDAAYFHAQFRRSNPLPYKEVYTILDGVKGHGHYVGTYMAWGVNNCGWWGEGEIKFFMDGDKEFPTICGTGTEDYFCGSYNFDVGRDNGGYPRIHHALRGHAACDSSGRSLQLADAVQPVSLAHHGPGAFQERHEGDDPGARWRAGGRYLPQQDDISSVAFWYQSLSTAKFPQLPDRDYLEII